MECTTCQVPCSVQGQNPKCPFSFHTSTSPMEYEPKVQGICPMFEEIEEKNIPP